MNTFQSSDMRLKLKILQDKVAAFESGEKYARMKTAHRKARDADARTIKCLKKRVSSLQRQVIDNRNMWMQINEDVLKEKDSELAKKDAELLKAREAMFEAQRQRDEALDKEKEMSKKLHDVQKALEEANNKNKGLLAKINKNSQNSGNPSSTDRNKPKGGNGEGDKKKKRNHKNNGRVKTGNPKGGQPGHIHHGRKAQEPTIVIPVPDPEKYANDPRYKATGKIIKKQLIKLYVTSEVIEYQMNEFRDTITGQRVHAECPGGLVDDVTYDGSVKAMAYLLTHDCNVSVKKTHDFLKDISHGKINPSTGLINNLSKQFSDKTEKERNDIFLELVSSRVLHADFTFGKMNGKQTSVIICTTPDGLTLFQGREKKGDKGVEGSPLELYDGIVISDHEAALIKHGSKHQECIGHVQRYARGSVENEPHMTWNEELLDWTSGSIHYWKQVDSGEIEYKTSQAEKWIEKLRNILEKAKKEYKDMPPNKYYKEGYNLYSRMYKDMENYVLFLRDPSIPPTNNAAERRARVFKRKAHQVISFRSQEGVDHYCDGISIIYSLKSKGENIYDAIATRFNRGKENECESEINSSTC